MTTLFSTPRTVETSLGLGLWLGIVEQGAEVFALVESKSGAITLERLESIKATGIYQATAHEELPMVKRSGVRAQG